MDVTIEVLTFKEGALSRVAHDLKLSVGSVQASADGSYAIDASSLRVVCAMKRGAPDPGALSEGDKRRIEKSIRDDVLHSSRYPEVRFVPSIEGDRVTGELHLHGVQRSIHSEFVNGVASFRLHQPDFGIKPFSALMGALKVKAHVEVRVSRVG
jgi:hypothetical protein